MKGRILIVDNDLTMLTLLREHLESEHWQVTAASSGADACASLAREQFAVVITELVMHPVDGLAVLREAQRLQPRARVVVMTDGATVERAVDAVRHGAYDYVTKPFNPSEPTFVAQRALEDHRLRDENRRLRDEVRRAEGFLERAAATLRERLAGSDDGASTRLVHRETGNLRELDVNAAERVATRGTILAEEEELLVDLHPDQEEPSPRPTLAELEIQYIRRVLADTNGDKRRAAEILGISVRTLQRMQAMSKLGDRALSVERAPATGVQGVVASR
jgi:DNA-binding NtrC family response regulator